MPKSACVDGADGNRSPLYERPPLSCGRATSVVLMRAKSQWMRSPGKKGDAIPVCYVTIYREQEAGDDRAPVLVRRWIAGWVFFCRSCVSARIQCGRHGQLGLHHAFVASCFPCPFEHTPL